MSEDRPHIVSYRAYLIVWACLLVLSGVTIGVARMQLGHLSVLGALLIASIKAGLVLSIFMHLRYEKPLFWYLFLLTVATISILIGLTFTDTLLR